MEDSEISDNSSIEIMNYLIKKLESTYNSILKFNNLLDSYDTSESFFTIRKDLKLFFTDLTENFNQGTFAIKALTNQNKKILEELKENNININNNIIINNKEENIRQKNNKFELDQLSNVKNIMDNLKKNRMRVKMILGQHFTNNQDNQNINDN